VYECTNLRIATETRPVRNTAQWKVDGHPGQFVIVLTLSKDVAIALKDHGGAASGYQSIVTYLETIEAILPSRYTSKGDRGSHGQANAIQTQAQSLGKSITGFGENVE